MNLNLMMVIIAGLCFTGCDEERATRAQLIKKERESLKCYCTGNAHTAEASLLECERYSRECLRQGVSGIIYDEVFARTYGRLYLVNKHLRRNEAAEHYYRLAADHYQRALGTIHRSIARPQEMITLIEKELDQGLRIAWRAERPNDLATLEKKSEETIGKVGEYRDRPQTIPTNGSQLQVARANKAAASTQ